MMKDYGNREEWNTGKNKTVLKVEDFRLCFNGRFGAVHAVRDANLEVRRGEIVAWWANPAAAKPHCAGPS